MKPLPLFLLAAATASTLHAAPWAQWRGPEFNGTSPETNLPSEWSASKGIQWSTPLPGPSGATPAVWGDSIFVTSPDSNKNLLLLCISRKDGKVRWQRQVSEGGNIDKGKGNMASPSPVTDGKAVYALFGTGDIAAFDFEGNPLWKRSLAADYGRFAMMWIYGSSPLLLDGKLYLQIIQRSPAPADYPGVAGSGGDRESFLLALNAADGKVLWKKNRPTEARLESMESYASLVPHTGTDGKLQLLCVGANCVSGHDPADGSELWRGFGLNRKDGEWMRIVTTPVSAAGLAIACGPKQEPVLAFRTDLRGDISEKGLAWSFDEKQTPDVCTPSFYKGKLFVLNGDKQTLTCLDPKTGEKKWQGNLGEKVVIRSSPSLADDKLYVINEKNTVFVCSTGDEFKILATIPMGGADGTRASIAISDGNLFIRTTEALHCIGSR